MTLDEFKIKLDLLTVAAIQCGQRKIGTREFTEAAEKGKALRAELVAAFEEKSKC